MRLWPAALCGGLSLSPTTHPHPPVQHHRHLPPSHHYHRRHQPTTRACRSAWVTPLHFSPVTSPAHLCNRPRQAPPPRLASPSPSRSPAPLHHPPRFFSRSQASGPLYSIDEIQEQSKFPEWVQQWKPSDESGCPEKMAWLATALPGVDIQQLVEAAPHVLFWSEEQLMERVKFLEEHLEGYDIYRVIADSPSLLTQVEHLREAFKMIQEVLPGKKIKDLFPPAPFDNDHPLREWGREWQEPYSTLVRLPFADPGLMNYDMKDFEEVSMESFPAWGSREEDRKEMVKFKKALDRSLVAFEVRVRFLREHYGEDQFQRYHADGLYEDVVGVIDEWINTHPGYESYLEDKLNGYQGKDVGHYRALSPLEKEDLYLVAYREGWGRDRQEDEEEQQLDLDEDELAALKEPEVEMSEQEREEAEEMERALKTQAWRFELRVGYMKEQMEDEVFRRTVGRDVNGLALGDIKGFLAQFPGYDGWMTTHLDGVDEEGLEVWAGRSAEEKEEVMISLMDDYGRTMYQILMERQNEPDLREALFTEEGQEAVWGQKSDPPKKSKGGKA